MIDRKAFIEQPLPLQKELVTLFPSKKPLVIMDIGACEAEDSIRYAKLFPGSTIYAFEPLPANIALAKSNLVQYRVHGVHLINKAVSDKNGEALFYVSSGQPPEAGPVDWDFGNKSSSLLNPAKHKQFSDFITFDRTITVQTITLDEFCRRNDIHQIDFIHLDVQGAEMMVLKGATESLRKIKGFWVEVSTIDLYEKQPLADEIDAFMNDHGFVMVRDCLYGISGERLYISRYFFPKYRRMFPRWTRKRSLLRRVLRKAGF